MMSCSDGLSYVQWGAIKTFEEGSRMISPILYLYNSDDIIDINDNGGDNGEI